MTQSGAAPRCPNFLALADGFRSRILVVSVILLANVTLVVGRHTGRFDSSDFFCPYFMLIADHARQGELLTWTPLVECGCPAGFDPEIGAFSPFTVGMAALLGPHEWAFRIYWLVIWSIGALGVLQLARSWEVPNWAAVACAIGYAFSAVFTNQTEYMAYVTVMAFTPATLWRLDVALQTGRILPALQAGAIWGLAALCGYPSLIIIGYCYFAVWTIGRALTTRGSIPILRTIAAWALFMLVSLVVLAPAYDGFLREVRGYSDRQQALPRGEAIASDALDPRALTTAASPYLAIVGAYRSPHFWTTDVANSSIYLSPLLVVLGLAAVGLRPRDRFRWWLAVLALFCLAAALGDTFPVRGWLYDLLPPMRYFRHAAVFRCHYLFTLLLLAMLAARDLTISRQKAVGSWQYFVSSISPLLPAALCLPPTVFVDKRLKRLALFSALLALLALCAVGIVFHEAPGKTNDRAMGYVAVMHAIVVWGGATGLLYAWQKSPMQTGRMRLGHWAVALSIFDAVLTVVLSREMMYTDRNHFWAATLNEQRSTLDLTSQSLERMVTYKPGAAAPVNACLVGKIPVLRCFNVLHNKFYDTPFAEWLLAKEAQGKDRIWFAADAETGPYDQSSLERLLARFNSSGELGLIVSDSETAAAPGGIRDWGLGISKDTAALPPAGSNPQSPIPNPSFPALRPSPVQVRKYTARHFDFDVSCAEPGWLLVTDRWASAWQAEVNGQPAKIWIGNLVFRAVKVERGANHVSFSYCPAALYAWLAASWTVLLVILASSIYHIFCPLYWQWPVRDRTK